MMRFWSTTTDLGLEREREDEISVKVDFSHGSSTIGFRPWVFNHGLRENDSPWVFSHEID